MVALPIRKQVQDKLSKLTDEQVAEVLRYIEVMESSVLPDDYDEDNDPSVGFFGTDDYDESHDLTIGFIKSTFTDKSKAGRDALAGFISGPTNVAEHTKDILRTEFALRKSDGKR